METNANNVIRRQEYIMQETPVILLEETFELLDVLIPVLQRNIDALQHESNPLLQHLIQQEIETYQQLLERTEETKDRLQDMLNSQEVVQEETDLEEVQPEETEPEESGSETVELEEDEPQEVKPEVNEPEKDEPPGPKSGINRTAGGHAIAPITVIMPDGTRIRRRHGRSHR